MFGLVFLSFLSFLCSSLLSRYMGRTGSSLWATIIMFVNIILTFILFYKVSLFRNLYFINLGTWIYSDLFQVNWSFSVDNLTITMLLVVNIISALVHLYSVDYMAQDPHLPRFMSYLSLFTFFMLLLVTGDNFVILFLGWEGVGLCSYLLISFWYTRLQANKAAIKALIVNRIADFALTMGIVVIFLVFKSLDFHLVFSLVPFFVESTVVFLNYKLPALTVICSLLFIGAMGKSAQIGLHTWLPDAMEGPTPVSALIHAATMVTAGVFLIIKCSSLFEYVPTVLSVITCVGATTAFFSATIGLVQNDIKKVIAYSTCSQLGYMIFACGLSNYHVSLFHLANHAFFKALLFLSAGAIIHSLSNEQDMRKFGGLIGLLPFTSIMLLIGSLSLMGFPFLTGFYSKDLILELALTKYTLTSSFAYSLGLITAFFTSFYSFRVFYMTFIYENNSFKSAIKHVHELPWKMALSLSVLSFGSIFLGYFAKDLFVGLGSDFWSQSIFILPKNNNQLEAEFFGLPPFIVSEAHPFANITYPQRWIKHLPFFLSLTALGLVYFLFSKISIKMQGRIFRTKITPQRISYFFQPPFFFKTIFPEMMFRPEKESDNEVIEEKNYSFITFVIGLYTPKGFAEAYKETGRFIFLFPVDDPFTPAPLVITNLDYHYYQCFLWEISDNRITRFSHGWKSNYRELYRFLTYKWYFDAIYNEYLNRPLVEKAYLTIFRSLDKGIFELFGPYGISYLLFISTAKLRRMQFGIVYYYAYFMLMFLLISLVLVKHINSIT